MISLIFIILFVICLWLPFTRCVIFNFFHSVFYLIRDSFLYFKHKKYNEMPVGHLIAFNGMFGSGKTLTMVRTARKIYKRYNDKLVWDSSSKSFVTQKVHIISNVHLYGIPYEYFTDLGQLVRACETREEKDELYNTRTCTLVLGDEFSVQLNSREFKKNLDPLLLNSLLTCRHHYMEIYYTSQRFNQVDALLRSVTQHAVECKKYFRFVVLRYFDAWEVENSSNVLNIQPLKKVVYLALDKDFKSYDTLACVENLTKSYRSGDMISEKEILELQNLHDFDENSVIKHTHRFNRQSRKRH